MTRRTATIDLAQALGRRASEREPAPVPAAVPRTSADGPGATVQGRAPSRNGQTNISGWFDMPVKLKLDELRIARQTALGRRVTQQELLSEAFNDLFMKYGLPEMAPSRPDR